MAIIFSPSALLAALVLSGPAQIGSVSDQALLDAFRMACLNESAPSTGVETAALAAGYHAVPLLPAAGEVHETGAWEKDGVRIFTLSPQTDPRWPLPAACAARANLGQLGDEDPLLQQVGALGAIGVMEGQPGRRGSHWTLPWTDGRLVQVFIDRTHPTQVSVTLYTNAADH